jgi:putative endonuclease
MATEYAELLDQWSWVPDTRWRGFRDDAGLYYSSAVGIQDHGAGVSPERQFYLYILASRRHGTLYIGVTGGLVRRAYEHRIKAVPGFTKRHGIDRLVHYEIFDDPISAITREKQLKKWRRDWKIALIEEKNPDRRDLFDSIAHGHRSVVMGPHFRGDDQLASITTNTEITTTRSGRGATGTAACSAAPAHAAR